MAIDLMGTLEVVLSIVVPLRQARSLPPTAHTFPLPHITEAPVLQCVESYGQECDDAGDFSQ